MQILNIPLICWLYVMMAANLKNIFIFLFFCANVSIPVVDTDLHGDAKHTFYVLALRHDGCFYLDNLFFYDPSVRKYDILGDKIINLYNKVK